MTFRAPLSPLQYGVKLLAQRSYSEKSLRQKLAHHDFLPAEIDQAVAALKEKRFLDDRQYAENFIHARLQSRPCAANTLIRDLLVKGISLTLAKEIVTELCPVENEVKLARDLLKRKQSMYAALDDMTRKRRLFALLARRGFKPDTIRIVLGSNPDDSET